MKFSIITPTYRRHEKLSLAVSSLLAQTYTDWEMIIVNDSPHDESYREFGSSINDPRIRYYVNDTNQGVNFSRNFALEKLSADSRWVIFLDDDDYLSPDALATLRDTILVESGAKWILTNRAYKNGVSVTVAPSPDTYFNYVYDYLLLKRVRGDATHCIETKTIIHNKISFSKFVKQGEEWFFFYQLGLHTKLFYRDHNSTITDGYDVHTGLNFRKRSFRERYESIAKLFYEGGEKKILKPTFLIYLAIRLLLLIVPKK